MSLDNKAQDLAKKKKQQERQEQKISSLKDALTWVQGDVIDCFADENGDAWIQYQDGTRERFHEIESQSFEDHIRVTVKDLVGEPKEAWVQPIVKYLASVARRKGKRRLFVRQAAANGAFYIQIDDLEKIRIKPNEIRTEDLNAMFRIFGHQEPFKVDLSAKPEDLQLLDKYTNFADHTERELFKTVLCALHVPSIPKPIQLTRGPPGSAKSTLSRLIKNIIDPTTTMNKGIALPKNDGDWWVNCREHLVLNIDNVNRLSSEDQDECCRIITGKNSSQRKLYTNNGTVTGTIQAILCINGIDFSRLKSDFLDRSIIWELQRIPDDARKNETDFYNSLQQDLPKIRGAIVRIISKAMSAHPTTAGVQELRLSDFAKWSMACAQARGQDPAEFANALKAKVELQGDESILQSWLMEPLQKFMEGKESWQGTAKELLNELTKQEYGQVEGDAFHERLVLRNVPKDWPLRPEALSKELSRLGFLFPRIGLNLQRHKGSKGKRILIIENRGKNSATPATRDILSTTKDSGSTLKPERHQPPQPPPSNQKQVAGGRWVAVENTELPPKSSDDKKDKVAGGSDYQKISSVNELIVTEEDVL